MTVALSTMRALALPLIFAAACGEAPAAQVPAPQETPRVQQDKTAPAAASSQPVASSAATGPRFRLRLALDGSSFCHLTSIAPIDDRSAWTAGGCNLRMLLHPGGVDMHLGDDERLHFDSAHEKGACLAGWTFSAIVASSRDDAYALADQRCGMAFIGAIWPRPMKHFDGAGWKDVPGRAAAKHLWHLARTSDGTLWGMTTGENEGSPNEAVFRWSKIGWQPVSFAVRSDEILFDVDRFAVTDGGEIWLPHRRGQGAWRGAPKTGWTFHPLPPGSGWATDVVVGEDGAPYVVCRSHIYRWDGQAFVEVGPGGRSAWPRSANDIFIAANEGVAHYDGSTLTPIPFEEPERIDFLTIRGAGGPIWALGRRAVWSLAQPGEDVPPPHHFEPHLASD